MTRRSKSAALAFLIVMVIGVLLLVPISSALPSSGLAAQEAEMAATPPAIAIDETERPAEASQPQGVSPAAQSSDHSPVLFVQNAGQWDARARFQVWGGPAGTMWLAEDAIWITLLEPAETSRLGTIPEGQSDESSEPERMPFPDNRINSSPSLGANIKLSFVGANPQPRIETFDRLDTTVSYFLGNDPEQWRPDVPVWGGVRYVDLYPGVDLELSGVNGQMTPRLAARPGADLSVVRLRVEGADAVAVNGGTLRLSTAVGEVVWPLLAVEGMDAGGAHAEASGVQAFYLAAPLVTANSQSPAAIDAQRFLNDGPADLRYSTFLGNNSSDEGRAVTVDGAGSAYVTGHTDSSDFPTTPGAFASSLNGTSDAFIAKLNATGGGLAYATFLGGSNHDYGHAIVVDGTGNAYVTGETDSSNFPTTPGAFDTSHNGGMCSGYPCFDAFIAKLNPSGSGLAYATYLGGDKEDGGSAIAANGTGSVYLAGYTYSNSFPTTPGAFDTSFNGTNDVFVVKLNPAGSGLAYATFLGGSSSEGASGIAVDGAGSAYVAGSTASIYFPTTLGAFDTGYNGGYFDGFIAKLNPAGSGLAYATLLGGTGDDRLRALAVDGTGDAYVTGMTGSSNFPTTPGSFDTSHNGGAFDAFMVKLSSTGNGLVSATFLGGDGGDVGYAIAVDGAGNTYLAGYTSSSNFPTTQGAFDTGFNGTSDAFVVKLNPSGNGLSYASYLGGNNSDISSAIAVDGAGSAYVTGETRSSNFPTTPGAFDTSFDGGIYGGDAFVTKLATAMFPKGYLPLVVHHSLPTPDAPSLNAITSPGANPRYTVRWNSVPAATSYLLQRATNPSFGDSVQVYLGAATTYSAPSQGIARHYYRVQARNQYGSSPWSNVQWVDVRWEQEPNYPLTNANGPLLSGLDYYGFPNDADDYFFFQVASRGQVTIDLTNHIATGVQLVLRNTAGERLAVDNAAPYRLEITVDPGRYYVHIYAADGYNSTTPYTLRATFP